MDCIKYADFSNICRICLLTCDMKFSLDHVIYDIYIKLSDGIPFETSELPQQICRKCSEKINEIRAFSIQCKEANSSLTKCLNEIKNVRIKEEPDNDELMEIKTEITIEEHKIEFVEVEELNLTSQVVKDEVFTDNIEEAAKIVLLPEKSKVRYNQTYESFSKWCTMKNLQEVSETVMLTYFLERSEALKSPASLWCEYSMLKQTLLVQKKIDLSKFFRLKAFLKRKNDGYQPRKSKNFTKDEIDKFIVNAPNETYLLMKVVAILGVAGALRSDELYRMKFNDIELKDDVAIVKILETKTNTRRSFAITKNLDWLKLLRNYMKLRPVNAVDQRFFFRYERGRCVNQVVGKHTIANIPRQIAKFLKLDNINEFTGHAFRRTSANILANTYDEILHCC